MFRTIVYLILITTLLSCFDSPAKELSIVEKISVPSIQGGESNLFISETDHVYLSWVEYLNDTIDELQFSILEEGSWSSPTPIASGGDWFVNWADFPSLVAYNDGGNSLAAHWLQKSADGTYDYDVRISQSLDGGNSWKNSFIPHRDGISAEHGFVTMIPLDSSQIFATWLDGRYTKNGEENTDSHGHSGSMTLRSATYNRHGTLSEEYELDPKVCDCCQTDAVLTKSGILVAYRDRSDREIRDISVVSFNGKSWSEPRSVYNDQWHIAGCPVNGPALDALGDLTVVAWYTMSNQEPQVKLAFSKDGGLNFNSPIRVDSGNPIGRVDVEFLDENRVVISWMETKEDKAEILFRVVDLKGNLSVPMLIEKTSASRRSGFPIMEKTKDHLYFSWTAVDSLTKVNSARLSLKSLNK